MADPSGATILPATDLKFVPFSSEIELPFYSALFSSKLEHDKLDESARQVLGVYEPQPGVAPEDSTKMQVLGNALTSRSVGLNAVRAEGIIRNKNTMDAFKNADRAEMIQNAGRQVCCARVSMAAPRPVCANLPGRSGRPSRTAPSTPFRPFFLPT